MRVTPGNPPAFDLGVNRLARGPQERRGLGHRQEQRQCWTVRHRVPRFQFMESVELASFRGRHRGHPVFDQEPQLGTGTAALSPSSAAKGFTTRAWPRPTAYAEIRANPSAAIHRYASAGR